MKKTKTNKKEQSNKIKLKFNNLCLLIIFAACIVVPILIHSFSANYNLAWCICTIVFLMVPFGATGLKDMVVEKAKVNNEQDKIVNSRVIQVVLYFWFMDFVALCVFQRWLVMSLVFGIIALIIIYYNISLAFVSKSKYNRTLDYGILFDFVFGIALTVYLIYIIPNADVKEIVIPVVAAVYGGLLTLVGVVLTIKKSDRDRKEDEVKKAKPMFAYNMLMQEPRLDDVMQRVCMSDTLEQLQNACDVYVVLENSNLSTFEIKRIYHDDNWVNVEGNTIVLPSSKCILNFRFSDKPTSLFLEIEDILGNKYYYQMFVLSLMKQSSNGMLLHTVREIKAIATIDMEKVMKEAN